MKILITIFFLIIYMNTYSQQKILATIGGGDLYSFDLSNCTRQFIGSTGINLGDIAFTTDGRLWGVFGNQLYQIDTVTANATLVGNMGVGANALVELNDSILLVVYQKKLFSINTQNALETYIDTIGYETSGDLTWYDNDLYIVTSDADSQIVKIVLNNTFTDIISVTAIGNSIPRCAGAVTASFAGEFNSIVGFSGADLIKICHIDGSAQMLCSNLNVDGTPGAASKRLLTQTVQPTFCNVLGIQENISQHYFSIYPNPTNNNIYIKEKGNKRCVFNIYNLIGQQIKTGILQENNSTIFVGDLSEGQYLIELIQDNKYEIQKFVLKK